MSVPTATRLQANMGRIYGGPSSGVLPSLLSAIGSVIDRAHADGQGALAQLNLLSSSAVWLDQWGALFGVSRLSGEGDVLYAPRIVAQVIRQRPQGIALQDIVQAAFNLTVQIRDLYPYCLLSDQWTTPPGRPPQVSDGQLTVGFNGSAPDNAVRCDYLTPYLPGHFGVWIQFSSDSTPYSFTMEDIRANFPLVLFSDDPVLAGTMVSDGQIGVAAYGLSFGPVSPLPPFSVSDVLALINANRAAGTQSVFMQITHVD
ncbi:MAG: hypothetical protein Q7U76_13130 [Nitrospirota bacterium]|nr:hypothetical protein [Nitrospirota bacterium]